MFPALAEGNSYKYRIVPQRLVSLVMSKSILIFQYGYRFCKQEWDALSKKTGYRLVHAEPTSHQEFLSLLKDQDVEVIVNTWPGVWAMGLYNAELIAQLPKSVKAIVHEGAGYDVLGPIDAWAARGILCANAPYHAGPSTADTAVWLLFSALRNFYRLTTNLRAGKWVEGVPLSHDPEGHTVGIVGMGNIGRMIRDRLQPFGFEKIQYYNRSRLSPEIEKDTVYVDYETPVKTSDIIVFACPYNKATHHLYNAEAITKSKDGVVIVNISRGGVIDEQALVDGLEEGKIRSVGLDVYENEPKVHPDLVKNDNVMLLPHAATLTYETRRNSEREVIENVRAFIETGKLLTPVSEMKALNERAKQ